jgi:3-phenylpropionate/cinnamic acid dioxygenase small subunit
MQATTARPGATTRQASGKRLAAHPSPFAPNETVPVPYGSAPPIIQTHPEGSMADPLAELLEKDRVQDVITRLFIATDERDWTGVLDCFTDQVLFDMQSLTGQPPATMPAREITAGWETGLKPIQAVHHQVGNFRIRVSGATAEAFCYGIASHYLRNATGNNTRTFVGTYDFSLTKQRDAWKITRFKFNLKYVEGNLNLEQFAPGER